jgi:hypothetical protein
VNVQLPPGATQERALSVMQQVEGFILKQPEVQSMVGVMGFSFSGQGQNAGLAFVTLKDWDERKDPAHSASALAGRAFGALSGIRDAFIYPLSPPPIPELGNATGFSFRLQDRAGAGHEALINARNQLLGMAGQSKILAQVRPDGLEDAPQLQIDIDRDKANALGVTFDSINSTLSTGAGLELRERLPEPRPPAARGGAGRRAGPHAARRPAEAERQQHARACRCRSRRSRPPSGSRAPRRRCATTATRPSASAATRPWLQHGRRNGRDGKARHAAARKASASNGPASRVKKSSRARSRSFFTASRSWRCSCAWPRCTRAGRFRWR